MPPSPTSPAANNAKHCHVHKFGGSSVADATRLRSVWERVRDGATRSAVVVSALRGVTDELVGLIESDVISGKIAKDVFEILWDEGGSPAKIVEDRGLKQVTDTGAIEAVIDQLIAENPDQAEQVKEKPKAMGWFVGQVMKAMQGKANPQAVNEILKKKLGV